MDWGGGEALTGGPWGTALHVLTDLEATACFRAVATPVFAAAAVLMVESMSGTTKEL